jgi:hypothetical protein
MKTDKNRTDSLNPDAIEIDGNQERVEWREEKRGGLLPIHTPWQETVCQKKRHAKEHECPNDL